MGEPTFPTECLVMIGGLQLDDPHVAIRGSMVAVLRDFTDGLLRVVGRFLGFDLRPGEVPRLMQFGNSWRLSHLGWRAGFGVNGQRYSLGPTFPIRALDRSATLTRNEVIAEIVVGIARLKRARTQRPTPTPPDWLSADDIQAIEEANALPEWKVSRGGVHDGS